MDYVERHAVAPAVPVVVLHDAGVFTVPPSRCDPGRKPMLSHAKMAEGVTDGRAGNLVVERTTNMTDEFAKNTQQVSQPFLFLLGI